MLWLRGVLFTVLIPGVIAFFIPQGIRHGPPAGGMVERWLGVHRP